MIMVKYLFIVSAILSALARRESYLGDNVRILCVLVRNSVNGAAWYQPSSVSGLEEVTNYLLRRWDDVMSQ